VGTLDLEDIRSTPIDDVIAITANELDQLQLANDTRFEHLRAKEVEQTEETRKQLRTFNVKLRECHPMFLYEEFEEELRERWMEEDARQLSKDRCYLCSLPHHLIACEVNLFGIRGARSKSTQAAIPPSALSSSIRFSGQTKQN
jgi:hypothetical protein